MDTEAELRKAQAEYDAAPPEERAEFEKQWEPKTVAQQFLDWSGRKRRHLARPAKLAARYANRTDDERAAFEADMPEVFERWLKDSERERREKFLRSHGFQDEHEHYFTWLPTVFWSQLVPLIESGQIKPAPTPPSPAQPGEAP
jgi:hypothetical protein